MGGGGGGGGAFFLLKSRCYAFCAAFSVPIKCNISSKKSFKYMPPNYIKMWFIIKTYIMNGNALMVIIKPHVPLMYVVRMQA